jgi:hypothetical protein
MALWDKLSTELRSAGKAARGAIDEGKLRLELFRIRQLADKAAQALGYAVHQAHTSGNESAPDTIARLEATLTEHENEAKRLEAELAANTTSGDETPKA